MVEIGKMNKQDIKFFNSLAAKIVFGTTLFNIMLGIVFLKKLGLVSPENTIASLLVLLVGTIVTVLMFRYFEKRKALNSSSS